MAEYKDVILKTIKENEQSGYGLWIVQTFKDGVSQRVQVRCGQKWKGKDGSMKLPIGGLEPADFDLLKPHYPEFLAASKNPPAMPGTQAAPAPAEEEETPF